MIPYETANRILLFGFTLLLSCKNEDADAIKTEIHHSLPVHVHVNSTIISHVPVISIAQDSIERKNPNIVSITKITERNGRYYSSTTDDSSALIRSVFSKAHRTIQLKEAPFLWWDSAYILVNGGNTVRTFYYGKSKRCREHFNMSHGWVAIKNSLVLLKIDNIKKVIARIEAGRAHRDLSWKDEGAANHFDTIDDCEGLDF